MLKRNDSCSATLQFVLETNQIIGQFYNSWDKQYHLASYIPGKVPPAEYLCGRRGNLSASRAEANQRKGLCCPGCAERLRNLSGLEVTAFNAFGFT